MARHLKITQAGVNALNTANTGLSLVIANIQVGSGVWDEATFDADALVATSLRDGKQLATVSQTQLTADSTYQIMTHVEGISEYDVREIGYFLADGTLFALDVDTTAVMGTVFVGMKALFVLSVKFSDADNITITVDAQAPNFNLKLATSTQFGSIELANPTETASGTNGCLAVTPYELSHIEPNTFTGNELRHSVRGDETLALLMQQTASSLLNTVRLSELILKVKNQII